MGASGCESTQEKSAQLEREATHVTLAQSGLHIAKPSRVVTVLATTVLRGSEGAAVAVTVRNASARTLRGVPLAVSVQSAAGQSLYENNSPGVEAPLVSIPSLPAHATLTWVDDQVPANGKPARATARVGEAGSVAAAPPRIVVSGLHAIDDSGSGAGAAGTVENRSTVAQSDLAVFVVARRGGQIVAAARAVLPSLAARASAQFQAFLVGDARGATLEASAPAGSL